MVSSHKGERLLVVADEDDSRHEGAVRVVLYLRRGCADEWAKWCPEMNALEFIQERDEVLVQG